MRSGWSVYALLLSIASCAEDQTEVPYGDITTDMDYSSDEVPVRLMYGESHGISWTDVSYSARLPALLTVPYMEVLGLDYHYRKGWLYYSGWGLIWRLPLNETGASGPPQRVVEQADNPTSLAVDWINDGLYWVSPSSRSVQRTDLEGGGRAVILRDTGDLNRHHNIALDPHHRLLFLAVDGGFIRARLDGRDRRMLRVQGHLEKRVVSLAVDIPQRRLFVSARLDHFPRLLSCDYSGASPLEYDLTGEWWSSLPSLAVYRDQLYWTHQGSRWGDRDSVWKVNVTDDGIIIAWEKEYTARGTILDPENRIWSLRVYHPDLQTYDTEEASEEETGEEGVSEALETSIASRVNANPANCITLLSTVLYFFCRLS